jgi:hypothetical protein
MYYVKHHIESYDPIWAYVFVQIAALQAFVLWIYGLKRIFQSYWRGKYCFMQGVLFFLLGIINIFPAALIGANG